MKVNGTKTEDRVLVSYMSIIVFRLVAGGRIISWLNMQSNKINDSDSCTYFIFSNIISRLCGTRMNKNLKAYLPFIKSQESSNRIEQFLRRKRKASQKRPKMFAIKKLPNILVNLLTTTLRSLLSLNSLIYPSAFSKILQENIGNKVNQLLKIHLNLLGSKLYQI